MHGLQCRPAGTMISPRARQEWTRWESQLRAAEASDRASDAKPGGVLQSTPVQLEALHGRQDTVGAVACDAACDLAAGVSRYTALHLCKIVWRS